MSTGGRTSGLPVSARDSQSAVRPFRAHLGASASAGWGRAVTGAENGHRTPTAPGSPRGQPRQRGRTRDFRCACRAGAGLPTVEAETEAAGGTSGAGRRSCRGLPAAWARGEAGASGGAGSAGRRAAGSRGRVRAEIRCPASPGPLRAPRGSEPAGCSAGPGWHWGSAGTAAAGQVSDGRSSSTSEG